MNATRLLHPRECYEEYFGVRIGRHFRRLTLAAGPIGRAVALCLALGSSIIQGTTGAPPLSVERAPEGFRVTWPRSAGSYFLEEAATLDGSWGRVNAAVHTAGDDVAVTVRASQQSKFFRLRGQLPLPINVPASMSPLRPGDFAPRALLAYLNLNYFPKAWPAVQDLVKNRVIHDLRTNLRAQDAPLNLVRAEMGTVSLDMNALPAFQLQPEGGGVTARFPETGAYPLRAALDLRIHNVPRTGAGVNADVSMSLDVWPNQPPMSDADALVAFSGIPSLAEAMVMNVFAPHSLEQQISRTIAQRLGLLEPTRFDAAAPFAVASPQSSLLYGDSHLNRDGALDIVLVADGFEEAQLGEFGRHADAIVQKLTQNDPNHVNEPFASFRSLIRFQKVNSISPAGRDAERIVTSTVDDPLTGGRKLAVANLARLARAGLLSYTLGGDILVVLSASASPPGTRLAARSFGDLVLLPVSPNNPEETATILVHELGHTWLGGLADESVDEPAAYLGLEPVNPNVQLAKTPPAESKWSHLTANPQLAPWDRPVRDFDLPGAYQFGPGICRPAEQCKMREPTAEAPFCQVCRESLLRGIMQEVRNAPQAILEASYSSPWSSSSTIAVSNPDHASARKLQACRDVNTVVRLRVVNSVLPRPWSVTWVHRSGGSEAPALTGEGQTFSVRQGDRIVMTLTTTCPFLGGESFPVNTVTLDFSEPGAACPSPPANPTASYSTTTEQRQVERWDAGCRCVFRFTIPVVVARRLRATTSEPNGDRVKFEFEVKPVGTAFDGRNLLTTGFITPDSSFTVSGSSEISSSTSDRQFRVRAVDETGRASEWVTGPRIPRS